jgi:hypothetical protein
LITKYIATAPKYIRIQSAIAHRGRHPHIFGIPKSLIAFSVISNRYFLAQSGAYTTCYKLQSKAISSLHPSKMLPRPRFLQKWRAQKTAVPEKKASGKSHGKYTSVDETTIVESRQDSDEDERCGEEDTAIKHAGILDNLHVLIEEAKAAIEIIEAKTKPAVGNDNGDKDNQDIQNLNTMIKEAKSVIEELDSKVLNSSMEESLRLLFDDAQYVISQVKSAPVTSIVENGSLDIKKTVSCTEEGGVKSANSASGKVVKESNNEGSGLVKSNKETALEGLLEEVRLLTSEDGTSKRSAVEGVKPENIVTTETNTSKTNDQVDDRNFLVLMVDIAGEIGGMLAEDSAKLAERARLPQCWY